MEAVGTKHLGLEQLEVVRSVIPAVTHVDGTARIQIVRKETSPLMADVLKEFQSLTGVPILINTSFNLKGNPIVNSPVDAVATFLQSGIDILYIDRFRLEQPKRKRLYLRT